MKIKLYQLLLLFDNFCAFAPFLDSKLCDGSLLAAADPKHFYEEEQYLYF